MKFVLNIETSNQALTDESGTETLAELVADVAESVRNGYTSGGVNDYNGNKVGRWEYVPELITEDDDSDE